MANLIRKNNQAQVTAYQDSVFLHFIKGVSGVFKDVYDEFGYTAEGSNFTLRAGMGIVFGRQFELERGTTQVFNLSTLTGTKYVLVYAEVDTRDMANQKVTFVAINQSLSYPSVVSQNLISTEQGLAYVPLYRFIYTAGAGSPIGVVEKLFRTLVANYVDKALEVDSIPGTSLIKGRLVQNIISDDKDAVKNSENTEKINGVKISSTLKVNDTDFGLQRVALLLDSGYEGTVLQYNVSTYISSKTVAYNPGALVIKFTIFLRAVWNLADNSTLSSNYSASNYVEKVILFKLPQTTRTVVLDNGSSGNPYFEIKIDKTYNGTTTATYTFTIKNIGSTAAYAYMKFEAKIYGEVY